LDARGRASFRGSPSFTYRQRLSAIDPVLALRSDWRTARGPAAAASRGSRAGTQSLDCLVLAPMCHL